VVRNLSSPASSAKSVSYDLRPSKQTERKIMVDLLKIALGCGIPINEYRYVGMGANRFYDFVLFHKYLGIRNMISLEHANDMIARAHFNNPYRFIKVRNEGFSEFLSSDVHDKNTVFWLDYDGTLSTDITLDIAQLSTKLKVGDFCFVTVSAEVPASLRSEKSAAGKLRLAKDVFGDVAGGLTSVDVEQSGFHKAVSKILSAAFQNAFALRRDGIFVKLLQIQYADGVRMITYGGALLNEAVADPYRKRVNDSMPFLNVMSDQLYTIRSLSLTEKERGLFDRAVTHTSSLSAERNTLRRLHFTETDLDSYKELLRYMPRYVETIF
jgi:hypothetical protein